MRPTVLFAGFLLATSTFAGALRGQAQRTRPVVEVGVGFGMAALYRDALPATGPFSFSTNSASSLIGLAATLYTGVHIGHVGLRGEAVFWSDISGETMVGVLGGPTVRFGTRNTLVVELVGGSFSLPLSQEYHPGPQDDVVWWSNPMRTHHGAFGIRAGISYHRSFTDRLSVRLGVAGTTASVAPPRQRLFESPTSSPRLRYGYVALEVGLAYLR